MWRNRRSWQRNPLEEHGRRLGGRRRAGSGRVRRCLDAARRLAVHRLAGHRPLRHLPVGGRGAVRGRRLPDAGGRRAPWPGRTLQRRLRRHGQRHAAAGPVRRLCVARRRRPVRAGLRAGDRTRRQGAARPLRRFAGCLLAGLLRPTRTLTLRRRLAAEPGLHGRLLVGRCRRDGAAPLRRRDRRAHPGDLGPMAGRRPGPHGPHPRRGAALHARHLAGCRPRRRVLAGPGHHRVPSGAAGRRGGGGADPLRAVRGRPHQRRMALSPGPCLAGGAARPRRRRSGASGRPSRKPWPTVTPRRTSARRSCSVSMPSAISSQPDSAAKWTMPATSASRAGSRWTFAPAACPA